MSRSSRIFLDLDGVLADMVGAALRRLGFPPGFVWPPGVWGICRVVGRTPADFWPRVADHAFWADEIQPLPHAHALVRAAAELVGIDRVRILTRPTASPFSASGKVAWLQTHFPELARQYSLTVDKTDVGRPDDCLVDDSPDNYEGWRAAGGAAVLWPAPWNYRHADTPARGILDLRLLYAARDEAAAAV